MRAPLTLLLLLSSVATAQFFGGGGRPTPGDPRARGAVCNGTTDDTTAIAAQLATGYLYIPAGVICVTGRMNLISTNFVMMFGGGALKLKPNTNDVMLFVNGGGVTTPANAPGTYLWIENLKFDGNTANNSGTNPCIYLQNAAYSRVRDNTVYNCRGPGIQVANRNANGWADEVNLEGNHVFSNGGDGILITREQGTGGTVNTTSGSASIFATSGSFSALTDLGSLIVITGCGWSNNTATITAIPSSAQATVSATCSTTQSSVAFAYAAQGPGDHLIAGNHVNYNTGNGIKCTYCFATLFSENNILTNGANGLICEGCSRTTANNNQIRYNWADGILHTRGADLTNGRENIITANSLHLNNRGNVGASNAEIWYQTRPIFANNFAGDTDFSPFTSLYGLYLFSSTNASIGGNNLANNLTGAFLTGGSSTYTAQGNVGLADTITTHTHADAATGGTLAGSAIASGTVAAARLGTMTGATGGAAGAAGAVPAPAAGDNIKLLSGAGTFIHSSTYASGDKVWTHGLPLTGVVAPALTTANKVRYVWTWMFASTSGAITTSSSTLRFYINVANSTSCAGSTTNCGLRFAIYSKDMATQHVTSAVLSGSALNSTGLQSVALQANVTLPPGIYALVWTTDSTTIQLQGVTVSGPAGSDGLNQAGTKGAAECANSSTGNGSSIAFPGSCGTTTGVAMVNWPSVLLEF